MRQRLDALRRGREQSPKPRDLKYRKCSRLEKRIKNAIITLAVGLALNILLGAAKLAVGIVSRSAAVSSDALNNISDAAVSIVAIVATWLSSRGADHEHPFGHGRYEYLAAFVLGAVIVAVGAEAFIGGVERIIEPTDVEYGAAVWATLGSAVAVKSGMAVFYGARYKKNGSQTVKAAAFDSLSDAAVTTVVLVCAVVQKFTGAYVDGYATVAVAVCILIAAFRMIRSTVDRLLGARPDAELTARVNDIVLASPQVVSVHDLIINDYGATYKIAEIDAVFPSEMSFTDVHAACDGIERRVKEETGVRLCVHADPLSTDDSRVIEITDRINSALAVYGVSVHDVTVDDERQTVSFDVRISDKSAPQSEITAQAEAQARAVVPYSVEINVDRI